MAKNVGIYLFFINLFLYFVMFLSEFLKTFIQGYQKLSGKTIDSNKLFSHIIVPLQLSSVFHCIFFPYRDQALDQPHLTAASPSWEKSYVVSSTRWFCLNFPVYATVSFKQVLSDTVKIMRSCFHAVFCFSHTFLIQRLLTLQTCDEDHEAYTPHCYAHEGEFISNADLDTISIAETDFQPETLNNIDHKFNNLATICSPPPMKTWPLDRKYNRIIWVRDWDVIRTWSKEWFIKENDQGCWV